MSEPSATTSPADVAPPVDASVPLDADGKPLSKKALNKLKKEQAKAEAKAKRQQEQQQQAAKASADVSVGLYGTSPLIQSTTRSNREFTRVSTLNKSLSGTTVLLRGRIHTSRQKGNLVFITLRQQSATVQIVASKGPAVSTQMIKFLAAIPSESIVDVTGNVVAVTEEIYGATQRDVEIQVLSLFVVSTAQTPLPIQIEDAERAQPLIDAQVAEIAAIEAEIESVTQELAAASDDAVKIELQKKIEVLVESKSRAQKFVVLSQPSMLDNRIIDLRTTTNQAIFAMQSGVGLLFREFLINHGFIEIHTPKLISAASEGGADVFAVKYFERQAYLAQSPQLYKQMAVCSDFERVFEIAPVFRAEQSFTARHMTEFMGLDFEMAFQDHYHEVLDLIDQLFVSIFDGLATRYAREIEVIKRQFPFEDLVYHRPSLRLNYTQLIDMLREDGNPDKQYTDDISTPEEKRLGVLIKEKYNADFYIADKFPLSVRPFYTMPDPTDERFSNSYDIFLRGQEIMSGAQRVHDSALLERRAREKGVDISTIQDYIDAFKFGAPPHAGGGIGLERIVMLYLNLGNIRKTSMFPRDPKRLTP